MFVKPREFQIYNRLGAPYYMVKDHWDRTNITSNMHCYHHNPVAPFAMM